MTRTVHELDRYEDIRAALANPDLVPELPAAGDGPVGASMAWLRASVARFSSGEVHTRRRALVEAELARLDPAQLRQAVALQPGAAVNDVRIRVVRTLAEALGLSKPDTVAEAVTAVADVYFGGEDPAADAAVAQLVGLLSAQSLEECELEAAAARICLLVQACDATAALVRHASAAATATGAGDRPIAVLLSETLRRDPPVRTLRRIAARDTHTAGRDIGEGDLVLLDTAAGVPGDAAESLAFGAPPRICPGREQALALASGILVRRPLSRFARLHHQSAPLLLPNAWDYASAAALAAAGFEAIGTTSLGVAAAAGLPDGAGVTADVTLALARQLGRGPFLFTVDIEGGFSDDPAQVGELARQLCAAGAAGINIEDGRGEGRLTPAELHAAKITAVKAAAPTLFVNARTDTHWLGCRQDETEDRLEAYQQAGADGVFVPGLTDPGRIGALASHLAVPLNVLYSPTGATLAELAALGVRRVSLGSLLYRRALGEAVVTAQAVRDGRRPTGSTLSYAEVQALSVMPHGSGVLVSEREMNIRYQ